jgi:hypothetical protein
MVVVLLRHAQAAAPRPFILCHRLLIFVRRRGGATHSRERTGSIDMLAEKMRELLHQSNESDRLRPTDIIHIHVYLLKMLYLDNNM